MKLTGLSGNEIYCLNLVDLAPGDVLIGNSVFSIGLLGSLRSSIRNVMGGELTDITSMIAEGRHLSLERLEKELKQKGASGATGVSSELIMHPGNIEFLSVGSAVHAAQSGAAFTSSTDGQELFCQIDAHYMPRRFVFGNVAYSIGLGGGIVSMLRQLGRGEVREYSQALNHTRHLALQRIIEEATSVGANSVVGIETSILPFGALGVQEMLMVGTASYHPSLGRAGSGVSTSDLTCEEMWNLASLGYAPLRLVLGASVYSLGVIGGITSFFKNFVRGEIPELTHLIYEAREHALSQIAEEASSLGADDVVGVKTHIYMLGSGLIEFLAIGTAVKKFGRDMVPRSPQLPPQAVIRDRDTFISLGQLDKGVNLNESKR